MDMKHGIAIGDRIREDERSPGRSRPRTLEVLAIGPDYIAASEQDGKPVVISVGRIHGDGGSRKSGFTHFPKGGA